MTAERLMKIGVVRAWASPVFTLGAWAWMLTRPAGTFHDQGGMSILLIYFPLTFIVWLYCTLTTSFLIHRAKNFQPPLDELNLGKWRGRIRWLRVAGLLLSVGTLFIA